MASSASPTGTRLIPNHTSLTHTSLTILSERPFSPGRDTSDRNMPVNPSEMDLGFSYRLKLRIELEDRCAPVRCKAHGKPHTHQFFALHPPHCLTVQLHVVCA